MDVEGVLCGEIIREQDSGNLQKGKVKVMGKLRIFDR